MPIIYFDPSKEQPFKRDGARIFILEDRTQVTLTPGTNTIDAEHLAILQNDDFFKKLIEYQAVIIRPEEEPPPAPVSEPPSTTEKTEKSVKTLRSPSSS